MSPANKPKLLPAENQQKITFFCAKSGLGGSAGQTSDPASANRAIFHKPYPAEGGGGGGGGQSGGGGGNREREREMCVVQSGTTFFFLCQTK